MKRGILFSIFCLLMVFFLAGCAVRTYPLTKDRVDQKLSGNRGYLVGSAGEEPERKPTRQTRVVEVEFFNPFKKPKATTAPRSEMIIEPRLEDRQARGNLGYISGAPSAPVEVQESLSVSFEKYTVKKNDTLQKISKKFYGTSRNWSKIYQANRAILKSPDSIYPGQVINIPVESLKETEENLK